MKRFETWWKEGVIYQIYPRSFRDSNHDGIGDLKGIIESLEYLQWLGICAIWLSPVYLSPMKDFGYDIEDYRIIDPLFGSNEDMYELIEAAHAKGIRIIMDMVINHTSDRHRWFIESASSIDSKYRNFYMWHDAPSRKKPNNWKAAFGGSAWEFDKHSSQYYLHSFLASQPDLNWRNPDVEKAIFNEMAFWLDKGVDGYRLDVINLIVKDALFRDNPKTIGETIRAYDMQRHVYDRDQNETHNVLRRMRSMTEHYDKRMLVGEIMVEKPGNPEMTASYQGNGNDELHLTFNFAYNWIAWDALRWRKEAEHWYRALKDERWPSWVLSNHDVKRSITRFGNDVQRAKISALFLLTQRGTPFLYYGEEIGMQDKPVAPWEIKDPVGRHYWPFHPGRDGQRRPMQWNSDAGFGFSTVKPWLPYHPDAKKNTVEQQKHEKNSLLHLYHDLIAIRNHDEALRLGTIRFLDHEQADVLAYVREYGQLSRLVLLNFSKDARQIPLSLIAQGTQDAAFRVIFNTTSSLVETTDTHLVLGGYQGLLLCEGE